MGPKLLHSFSIETLSNMNKECAVNGDMEVNVESARELAWDRTEAQRLRPETNGGRSLP